MKKESVNEVVRQRVAEIPEGKIFGYDVFGELAVTRRRALARALAWLVEHEEIERAYRGRSTGRAGVSMER